MDGVSSLRASATTSLVRFAITPSPASSPSPRLCRLPSIKAALKHAEIPRCDAKSGPEIISSALKDSFQRISQSSALRNAGLFAMSALWALPSIAEEVAEAEEKGKIFDFNLTLPIIAIEFLLLMVTLDNIWFKPVAKVMDERDEAIRQKLLGVRDNSDEIKQLQEEAEAILKAARAETTAELNKMKRETAAALDAKLQESRERIEKELEDALANLEIQKQETLKSLDKQVQELSDQIVAKVIPPF